MSIFTPRFSVCRPGTPPVEVRATNSLPEALRVRDALNTGGSGVVVYDWATGRVVDA